MKKHIIFKGTERTGKSLFARIIFDMEKTMWIDGRSNLGHSFPFDYSGDAWNFENIVIDDPRTYFSIAELFPIIFADEMVINRLGRELETVKTPRFIFIINSETIEFPVRSRLFNRHFHVIDFNENSISDLMKIIAEEKIIIKNLHR